MARYAAFFASMNVGGNRLKMADLRDALEREDLDNVETVVASGNVLFDYDDRPSAGLSEMLEHIVLDRFGFETFAAVRSREEVRQAVEENPFQGDGEEKLVHTVFLDGPVDTDLFDAMVQTHAQRGRERLASGDRCVFVDFVEGVGESRLTAAFIERRLDRRSTARNMRSLKRILEKMDQADAASANNP